MNMKDYLNTWRGLQKEKLYNRAILAGLTISVLSLSVAVMNQDKAVVFEPPYPVDKATAVYKSTADEHYIEMWATSVAQMVGNASPSHDKFLKERLGFLLHPAISGEVLTRLNDELYNMKLDKVTFSFEPKEVISDPVLNKTFVYGDQRMYSSEGRLVKKQKMTYEMRIEIQNFRPRITQFNAYSDKPKTTKYIMRAEEAAEREAKKNEGKTDE